MAARFAQLDALRFLFALIVVLGHTVGFDRTLVHGAFAVDFFFILSGFVLSHALITRPVSAREFAWARLARLYPLHLVTIACLICLTVRLAPAPAYSATGLILNLFMLQGLSIQGYLSWNYPAWSIGVEFLVNLLILYPIVRTRSLAAGLAVVLAAVIAILVSWGPVFADFTVAPALGPLVSGGLLRGMAGIVLGYLLYEAYLYLHPRIDAARHALVATLFESIVLALLVGSMAVDDPRWNLAPVPLSALLILQMATAPGRLSALFQTRVSSMLGDISYSIYLLHVPLFLIFLGADILPLAGIGFTPAWFAYLALLLALSVGSFRHLERPAQRALMRLSRGWSTTTAT